MTNLEVIKHLIGSNVSPTDERLSIAAQFAGISPDQDYDNENKCKVYGVAITELATSRGVKQFSEGDLSYTFTDASAGAIVELARASGCPDLISKYVPQSAKPVLRNASNRW